MNFLNGQKRKGLWGLDAIRGVVGEEEIQPERLAKSSEECDHVKCLASPYCLGAFKSLFPPGTPSKRWPFV
jgi:hypothetical protein